MAAFAPETLFYIGSFPVTNTVVNTVMVDLFLLGVIWALKDKIRLMPSKLQNVLEAVMVPFLDLTENVAGKNAAKIFPWFMSFFFFILIANWSGLLPGVGTIGYYPTTHETAATHTEETVSPVPAEDEHTEETTATGETHEEETTTDDHSEASPAQDDHADTPNTANPAPTTEQAHEEAEPHLVPYVRGLTSDLNATLALALISLVVTHFLSIRTIGIKEYLSRYFSLNPVLLFVGILEIVSEFTKIVSPSFRLFGNIFAGETVLHTVSGELFPFLLPIPFMMLEIIVGLVQALVFAMLTMVFMSVLMTPHHAEEHGQESSGH